MASQKSTTWIVPLTTECPAGVCIQELADIIQKAEKVAPSPTRQVAEK